MRHWSPLGSLVLGAPSSFTLWVFDVVKSLLAHDATRPVRLVDRNDTILEGETRRPVYLCQYPSRSVIDAIERGDVAVALVMGDPVDGVSFMMRANGLNLLAAIRAQTAAAVANLALGSASDVELLFRGPERTAREVVRRIARFLALTVDDSVIDKITHQLGGTATSQGLEDALAAHVRGHANPIRDGSAVPSEEWIVTAATVLDPLTEMARGQAVRPIVWPTEVFLSGDQPDSPAPPVAAVAGPARVLYYGPYFHLPPSEYRVEVILAFSRHIEDIPFSLEVHGSTCLARVKIDRRAEGGYRGFFKLRHTDPVDAIELRLRNEKGAIEGEVALVEVRFFPLRSG